MNFFLTLWNNALYRIGASFQLQIYRLEQFDSQKYLYSQKLPKYFLAKLPSKLIIAEAIIRGNTV